MFTVFIVLLGVPLAIGVALILSRRLDAKHARSAVVLLAVAASVFGFLALAWTVFGPSYEWTLITVSGSAVGGTQTLLDVGLSPLTAAIVLLEAICFGLVLLGALDRRPRRGRWLMLTATCPMVAIGMLSFGLALVLPSVILAVLATALAFAASPDAARASPGTSGPVSS